MSAAHDDVDPAAVTSSDSVPTLTLLDHHVAEAWRDALLADDPPSEPDDPEPNGRRDPPGDQRPAPIRALAGLDLAGLAAAPTEPDWLVQDRLARGWLVLLGAKPGVGKTWLAEDLAVALPTARAWLGHDIPARSRVLYIDAENGEDLALERLRQLGATTDELGDRLRYVTEAVTFPNPNDVARLSLTLDEHRPDLVILDTLASAAPSAERDTESAAAFYSAVWHLIVARRCALLLLVHLRKSMQGVGRDDPLDAFRGAGHLVGAAHRAWTLEPVAIDKPVFLLHDVKARRGRKLPTVRVEVVDDPDSDQLRTSVEVLGTVDEVESGYDAFLANVLVYLDATTTGEGQSKDLLLLPDAPPRRTANDYLTRAVGSGVLHKPRRGVYVRGGHQLFPASETEESAQ
jgi:hypothetical protein